MTSLERDILRRHGWASFGAALFMLLFFAGYFWQTPQPQPQPLYQVSVVYWLVQALFMYWIWSGRTRRYQDPSISLPVMLWGITYISAGLYLAPVNRDLALLTYLAMMPYGVFRLSWQQFLLLATYVVSAYGTVMLSVYAREPLLWPVAGEWLRLLALLLSLLAYVVLGREIVVLRAAYWRKNRDLRHAMSRIEELAVTDELTGLFNRRYLLTMLARHQAVAEAERQTFTLAFIDIDHFKTINDEYGHSVGDQVLSEISVLLRGSVRQVDLVARYGGEEFVLLLSGLNLEGGRQALERIRQKVMQQRFSAQQLALTVSAGVTQYQPGDSLDELLTRADGLLYEAKGRGRNRVVAGPPVQLTLAQGEDDQSS